jgi:hypothetical protein
MMSGLLDLKALNNEPSAETWTKPGEVITSTDSVVIRECFRNLNFTEFEYVEWSWTKTNLAVKTFRNIL